ncbi:MAG TPA: thiamine phosphate synthase [Oleiagrimonas sp.]|nr:thiamine phosphate synthase [Oleiagrimonas sp.]
MTHPALARGGLYAVTNGPRNDLVANVAAALDGGASMVQYRDKTRDKGRRLEEARAVQALCRQHQVPLIINDDVALAVAVGAAGVHLGENDAAPLEARQALGATAIIGVSCYDNIERARMLADRGADYLAFGAFFASPTKPLARHASLSLLQQAHALKLPLVAIGGITADNGGPLVAAGARFLAVISAVFDAPDVRQAARQLTHLFPTDPP